MQQVFVEMFREFPKPDPKQTKDDLLQSIFKFQPENTDYINADTIKYILSYSQSRLLAD